MRLFNASLLKSIRDIFLLRAKWTLHLYGWSTYEVVVHSEQNKLLYLILVGTGLNDRHRAR